MGSVSKNCFWKLSLKLIPSAFPTMWQALSYCLIISSCLNSSKWILFSATRQYIRRDDALRLRKAGSCAWGCFLKMLQVPLDAWDWLGPAVAFREATLDPDQVLCVFSLCLFSLGYLVTFYCAHGVIRKSRIPQPSRLKPRVGNPGRKSERDRGEMRT